MTKLLDHAFETARGLSPKGQDSLAHVILRWAEEKRPVIQLSAEEEADLTEADAEIERGELATDEQMQAIWAKHAL